MDKIILLRANKRPMPMPTRTLQEREAFWNRLVSELPAFCAFLESWEIPADLRSSRFGITHYHHPELLRAIDDLAPETRLWQLIETDIFPKTQEWKGSAADLVKELIRTEALTEREAERVFPYNTACGVYLNLLSRKHPEITKDRTRDDRLWIIRRGADWTGPVTGFSEDEDR